MSYTLMRHLRRTALLTQQIRMESTMTIPTQEDFVFRPPIAHWTKIIKEAEKIVGYPTSFMNLRWLLSDEFANLAMHLRKVVKAVKQSLNEVADLSIDWIGSSKVDSNHPIVKTVKTLLYNEHNNLQPWGLVILLLAKASTPEKLTLSNTVVENQRILAELTEMIRTGHYVHRGLLNIPRSERENDSNTALFANKIAILIGDYLLVTANGMLARLKNQDLSYLISTALRDLSEGEFFGHRDAQNLPLPGKPCANNESYKISGDTLPLEVVNTLGSPVREWTLRTMYNGGSLFGRGCQGAVLLSGMGLEEQENAYKFGSHLLLAWQASTEFQKIISEHKESFSLVSAPVLFALHENPELYNVIKNVNNVQEVDLDALKQDILKTDAVQRTKLLYLEHADKARCYAEMFGETQPIATIKRLIKTM